MMTVEQKQCMLSYFGQLPPSAIDGIWGTQSAKATERLQQKLGLTADGIWGIQTEAAVRKQISEGEYIATERKGTFWDHIRYWSREEFRCRCGEYHQAYCDGFPVEPNQTLVELVDDLRNRLGAPAHRSSGIRCVRHNQDSGGVVNSKHLQGKALDFFVEGIMAEQLLETAMADPRTSYAYIITPGKPYVHVDVA